MFDEQPRPLRAVPPPPGDQPPAPADVPGPASAAAEAPGTRRDVIPEPWKRHNLRVTLRQYAGLDWHRVKYHGVRLPWHATRFAFFAGRGVQRPAVTVLAWRHWTDGWVLESQAVARGPQGHGDAMCAHTEGKRTRAVLRAAPAGARPILRCRSRPPGLDVSDRTHLS